MPCSGEEPITSFFRRVTSKSKPISNLKRKRDEVETSKPQVVKKMKSVECDSKKGDDVHESVNYLTPTRTTSKRSPSKYPLISDFFRPPTASTLSKASANVPDTPCSASNESRHTPRSRQSRVPFTPIRHPPNKSRNARVLRMPLSVDPRKKPTKTTSTHQSSHNLQEGHTAADDIPKALNGLSASPKTLIRNINLDDNTLNIYRRSGNDDPTNLHMLTPPPSSHLLTTFTRSEDDTREQLSTENTNLEDPNNVMSSQTQERETSLIIQPMSDSEVQDDITHGSPHFVESSQSQYLIPANDFFSCSKPVPLESVPSSQSQEKELVLLSENLCLGLADNLHLLQCKSGHSQQPVESISRLATQDTLTREDKDTNAFNVGSETESESMSDSTFGIRNSTQHDLLKHTDHLAEDPTTIGRETQSSSSTTFTSSIPDIAREFQDMFGDNESYPDDFPMSLR